MATSSVFNTLFSAVDSVNKLRSTTGWNYGNGTNESGFNAYPCGMGVYKFQEIGNTAYFACSDQANNQWGWKATITTSIAEPSLMEKFDIMSIRLVKNLA
jgi:uncharacterized protein (TIGR02145 family)